MSAITYKANVSNSQLLSILRVFKPNHYVQVSGYTYNNQEKFAMRLPRHTSCGRPNPLLADIWGQSKNTYTSLCALPDQPYFYSDPKYPSINPITELITP